MFKCFFPRPALFFSSAAIWSLVVVLVWFGVASDILNHFPLFSRAAHSPLPATVARFWHASQLWFYLYFWISATLFALAWRLIANHPWQRWSVWGSALIIFSTWFNVQIGVAVNAWYGPFYDYIQQALTKAGSVPISTLYTQVGAFLGIALVAVVLGLVNAFFISHWVFRWRTAMTQFYTAHWSQLRHVEGAAQRVQEDTMRFASTIENWGVSFVQAIMTLIAFLPVLVSLSHHVKDVPLIGNVPYALVIIAVLWALFGTGLLALVGIKLPGLEFRNQRVEAAYRKELVYGEDDAERAKPLTLNQLFEQVRYNYFRLYFHYLYFNMTRFLYLQVDNIFGIIVLFPSIVAGTITLGLLNQITNVFDQVRLSFQYLINSWTTLIELMSIYKRLHSFEQILNGSSPQSVIDDVKSKVSDQ